MENSEHQEDDDDSSVDNEIQESDEEISKPTIYDWSNSVSGFRN